YEKLAELLLPHIDKTPEYFEELYPERNLPEGARVTRIAPSPTGYLHLGTLFTSLVNRITATSTGGIFYTRIEDTDKKREVEGGIEDIIDGLWRFGIRIDEGFISGTEEKGEYGPYQQSHRAEIYQTYVKKLIREGLAYPCFCTAEELAEVREKQEAEKVRTGYHGEYAKHRNISYEEAKALIDEGKPFVIRLRSPGDESHRITFEDTIKGKIDMPENDEDFVLLKSDGIPTYHFAHAIDDHLMHTTHVLRGDEWISSVPKHIQLFKLLGFRVPKYGHVSPIMKLDNGAKRKISKRKDPEAAVHFFAEQGYDATCVIEYLMTIAASDFEDWRRANPTAPLDTFKFNLKKMSVSGALFDENKLNDVSKGKIAELRSSEVYEKLTAWAKEFDNEFYSMLTADEDFSRAMLAIDRDDAKKPRKDIAKWSEAKEYFAYFFENTYVPCFDLPENIDKNDAKAFLKAYKSVYDAADDRQGWFDRIKELCPQLNFAADTKEYKANPDAFKGSAGDLSTVLRIAITGRRNTPDLCSIMQVLGTDRIMARIDNMIEVL
ncbi:MAG: glutamate--tRNA ligase, partial [Acutalibacteraceae bacterium]|nr:glutamate--tRNA ligase [Acutalibacteraceae bacterium]